MKYASHKAQVGLKALHTAKDDLELLMALPPPSMWIAGVSHQAWFDVVLGTEPRASCRISKLSAN